MNVIDQAFGENWAMYNGDSAEVLRGLPDGSIHLSVFSPPFSSLYTYSSTERDLGNTRNMKEFIRHFRFIVQELHRVMMPGRNVCVHIADLQSTVVSDGARQLKDFTSPVIRLFQRCGFLYISRITIDKNPQTQAARNKVHELMFVTKERDAAQLRPTLPDYILVFRARGKNPVPIHNPIDNETWIEWAHPIWNGIRETRVLNAAVARADQDERHMCPLQLDVIERCVRLWSNPGEVVLSPFGGIGSEGVEAMTRGRRFVGIELKPDYYRTAVKNLQTAEDALRVPDLFSAMEAEEARSVG